MAKTVVQVQYDISGLTASAKKVAEKTEEAFGAAAKAGLAKWSPFGAKNLREILKFQASVAENERKLKHREYVLQLNEAKKLADEKKKLTENLDILQKKSELERTESDKEAIDNAKELVKLISEMEQGSHDFAKNTSQLAKNFQTSIKNAEGLAKRMHSASESMKEIRDAFKDLKDPTKISEGLEDAAEKAGSAFRDGINVESLARDFGKLGSSAAKGLSKALKAAGGGSEMFAGLAAGAGAVAGLIAGLGVLLAAFIAVDKKVKEFNRDIVKTHGALSVMALGGNNLNTGLQIMKRTVMDLTANFGVTEGEARDLFDTLDKGGQTLDRLTRGSNGAAKSQEMLRDKLVGIFKVANLTGVSLGEYADNLTNYVNDLAMSTETVNESFMQIANMASKAGFGTRRFYSMVVQATSGQASLNTRLEDTGDLLMRMSKIMGAKKAAEAVGGEASRLAEQSATERAKTVLVTGARGGQIFEREARIQSRNFIESMTDAQKTAVTQALSGAGVTGAQGALGGAGSLVTALSGTSASQQREMLARLRAGGQTDVAQRLEQITQLNLGARGGLAERVGGIGALGAGGSFAMQAAMAERFIDPTTGRMGVPQRAAFESVTGLSGTKADAMLNAMAAQRGDLELMQKYLKQEGPNSQSLIKLMKTYGLKINEQNKIADSTGRSITNSNDLFQLTSEKTTEEIQNMKDETTSIAYQTMDATTSVADILENKVAKYIQQLYEWVNGWLGPLLSRWAGDAGADFERKRETTTLFEQEISRLQSQSEGDRTRMARLSTTATSDPSKERRDAAKAEIDRLTQAQTRRGQQIQGLREGVQRVREGNTFDTRNVDVIAEGSAVGAEQDIRHFASHEEAAAYMRLFPEKKFTKRETQISAADALRRARQRRGIEEPGAAGTAPTPAPGAAPTPAPGTAPAAAPGTAPAAAPTPGATPAPGAAPAAPPPARVAEAVNAPTVESVEAHREQDHAHNLRERRERRHRQRQEDRDMERLIKGKEMGDGIAISKLPDAIAVADAKMRFLEGLYAGGATPQVMDTMVQKLMSGEATREEIAQHAGAGAAQALALRYLNLQQEELANDFIYRTNGGRGVVTPINREDQVIGMKTGGPLANAMRGGGGNVHITINGGDERRVFDIVRRAIQQSGITPNRVPSGAT